MRDLGQSLCMMSSISLQILPLCQGCCLGMSAPTVVAPSTVQRSIQVPFIEVLSGVSETEWGESKISLSLMSRLGEASTTLPS